MAVNIALQPASSVTADAIAEAFTLAYKDYYVPQSMTAESFQHIVQRYAVNMDDSVVAQADGLVVGMALLGIQGQRGWVGAVGVIPAYRRQGIARLMMQHLLEAARLRSLSTLQLEVIAQNHKAHALYDSLEFVEQRRLLTLTCPPDQVASQPNSTGFKIRSSSTEEALDLLSTLGYPVEPAWGRELSLLNEFAGLYQASLAYQDDSPAGVCLYSLAPFKLNLTALVGNPGAGQALLHALRSANPDITINYINIADNDPLLPELLEAGCTETLNQLDMVYTIKD